MSPHEEGQHGHSINRRKFITAAGLFAVAPMVGRLGPKRRAGPVANAAITDEARWQTCLQLAREFRREWGVPGVGAAWPALQTATRNGNVFAFNDR